jgi:transposase
MKQAQSEPQKRSNELQQLSKQLSAAKDVQGVLRCKVLIAYYKGLAPRVIVACFGISYKSLKRWQRRYESEGVVSDCQRSGRPTTLPAAQAAQLKEMIVTQKQRVWTARHVCVVLQTVFGVVLSVKYLPQLLGRLGLSFHKAIHVLERKNNEKRRAWIQTTLPTLYADAIQNGWRIFFQDEVGFQTEGTLAYTWGLKGEQIEIPNYGRRGRVNLIGAFELGTGRFYGVLTRFKVDACRFRRFLCHLKHELRTDKLLLICDNARFHKATWLQEWLKLQRTWLRLEFLPAYSPDFNPIERLWRWFKQEYTHNACWTDQTALLLDLKQALIELPTRSHELLGLMRQELKRYKDAFDFYQTPFPEPLLALLPA